MITNKENHKNITYSSDLHEISLSVRNHKFVSLEELSPEFYEIVNEKQQITLDIPVVLGFTILQLAKLRMLEFYYDFIDRYKYHKHQLYRLVLSILHPTSLFILLYFL
jgi:hypothetical protein